MPKIKIEDLKTSILVDKIEEGEDDSVVDEMFDELYKRTPFEDTLDRLIELEEEISSLRRTLKNHAHLEGRVVVDL